MSTVFLFYAGSQALSAGADWVQDGTSLNVNMNQTAHDPSLAITNGTPYVAWRENNGTSNQVYVKHYNGLSWVQDGGSLNSNPNFSAADASMAFLDTTPYVAWREWKGFNWWIYVKYFNGSSWIPKGGILNVNSNLSGYAPSIAVSNGTPYVAWGENINSSIAQIYVKHYNGSNWEQDGGSLNINANEEASDPGIAFSNGTPYVCFNETDGLNRYVYVKHYNGSGWVLDGGSLNMNINQVTFYPRMAMANSTPYVTWKEFNGTSYQIFVKHYNGSGWVQDGGTLNVNSGGYADLPDIAVSGNTPYVSWNENNGAGFQIHVKHYTGSAWVEDNGILDVNASQSAFASSIAIFNGTPYAAWDESNGTNFQIYVKHYLPDPTPAGTFTITSTRTASPTLTATKTPAVSPTATPTPADTATATPTETPVISATISPTITLSPTISATVTSSPTATVTSTLPPYTIGKDTVITYPSPAKGNDLWFYYSVDGPTQVRIEIYNIIGEKMTVLIDHQTAPGYRRTHWNITSIAPGVYIYRMQTESTKSKRDYGIRRLVIVK